MKLTCGNWVRTGQARRGLPGKVISFYIVPLDPAYKAGLAGHVPAKRVTFGLMSLILAMLLILGLSLPVHAQTEPQVLPVPAPKRVLLLYTYGDGLPAYQKATPAFLSVTTAAGIDINNLFFEYLDLQRNNNAEYRQKLADLLRYKYAKHQVGLIVTVHTAALNFLLDEAKGLFPDAPIFSYLLVSPTSALW